MLRDGDVEAGKLPIAAASNPYLYTVEVIFLSRISFYSLHSSGHNPKAHMQPDAFTQLSGLLSRWMMVVVVIFFFFVFVDFYKHCSRVYSS
ncbi:hypothetical protein LI328DRAFT_50384 [Trichoderma asperelloides]|nr:hypothetical protein LI328DRAFT_50384 [Trichoderma asperelloides]